MKLRTPPFQQTRSHPSHLFRIGASRFLRRVVSNSLAPLLGALLLFPHFATPGKAQEPRPIVRISGVTTSYLENFGTGDITVRLTLVQADGTAYTNTMRRGVRVVVTGGGATATTPATEAPGIRNRNDDFWAGIDDGADGTVFVFTGSSPRTFLMGINDDDVNEGNESFTITVSDPTGTPLAGTVDFSSGAVEQVVTIVDNDPPGVTLTPSVVDEQDGPVDFEIRLNGNEIDAGAPTFVWSTADHDTALPPAGETMPAMANVDYTAVTQGNARPVTSGDGTTPETFSVTIQDDDDIEGDESFIIVVESPASGQGAGSIARTTHVVTIRDNDSPQGPDPMLGEISNHLVAQSDALLETQPRLTDYVRNTGIGASDFALRVSDGGLDSLDGRLAVEGFWGEATYLRSGSRMADGAHVVASMGAHRKVSNQMFLGGMFQYDRSVTKLDGGGRSGEFVGEGWMAGPYFVARDPTRSLFFEGRLLYGQASNHADAIFFPDAETDPRKGPRSGIFHGERWIAQARVEGEHPLGNGAIMYPLADLSHARNSAYGFDDSAPQGEDLDEAVRTSVSKLQLGAEFEIPLDPAWGDMTFRPGVKLVFSDRNGGKYGESELTTAGRVDVGIDYRLEDNVALGFQGYYSGTGSDSEFESYGAGLRLRIEF